MLIFWFILTSILVCLVSSSFSEEHYRKLVSDPDLYDNIGHLHWGHNDCRLEIFSGMIKHAISILKTASKPIMMSNGSMLSQSDELYPIALSKDKNTKFI